MTECPLSTSRSRIRASCPTALSPHGVPKRTLSDRVPPLHAPPESIANFRFLSATTPRLGRSRHDARLGDLPPAPHRLAIPAPDPLMLLLDKLRSREIANRFRGTPSYYAGGITVWPVFCSGGGDLVSGNSCAQYGQYLSSKRTSRLHCGQEGRRLCLQSGQKLNRAFTTAPHPGQL